MAKNINVGSSTFSSNSIPRGQYENLMEDFKSEMRQYLSMQMDTLWIQRKQEKAERALAIFCARCTRKHPRNECPLHSIEVCFVCEEDHPTNQCPSLLLASCCNRVSFFMIDIFTCQIFPEETKEETIKCASPNATAEFQF